jgi:hypothetical protein
MPARQASCRLHSSYYGKARIVDQAFEIVNQHPATESACSVMQQMYASAAFEKVHCF